MRRIYLILAVMLCASLAVESVKAEKVNSFDAKAKAVAFLRSAGNSTSAKIKNATQADLKDRELATENLYGFDVKGGGFVLVSGDSRTEAILGYSDSGSLDPDNMPDNLRSWLAAYDATIAALGDAEISTLNTPVVEGHAIEPLLTANWYQDAPYNDLCPALDEYEPEEHAPTGCPATAMAMIMDYYKWPQTSSTAIPEYSFDFTIGSIESMQTMHMPELPPIKFDWDNMLRNYSTEEATDEQKQAVAQLMLYCGQSVRTIYGLTLSGSQESYIYYALREYFGYDKGMRSLKRNFYSIADWEQIVYDELAAGRPVPYAGQSGDGGHSFVCDGYDGNGLFHINWGWAGRNNGYFRLSVLNPYDNTSVGSNKSPMGFCIDEEIITGVKPAEEGSIAPEADYSFRIRNALKLDGDSVEMWCACEDATHSVKKAQYALGTIDSSGQLTPLMFCDTIVTLKEDYFQLIKINVDASKLPDGETLLIPMGKAMDIEGSRWMGMARQEECSVLASVTEGKLTLKVLPEPDFEITDIKVTSGERRPNEMNLFTISLKNKGAEFCGSVDVYYTMTEMETDADLNDLSKWKQVSTAVFMTEAASDSILLPLFIPYNCKVTFCITKYKQTDVITSANTLIDQEPILYDLRLVDYELSYKSKFNAYCRLKVSNNDSRRWIAIGNSVNCIAVKVKQVGTSTSSSQDFSFNLNPGESNEFEYKPFVASEGMEVIVTLMQGSLSKELIHETLEMGQTLKPSTGVEAITSSEPTVDVWYNMQGVRIEKPVTPGIYIHNGEKVAITE